MFALIERPTRTAIGLVVALAVVVVLLHLYWPAGALFGAAAGVLTVLQLGRALQAQADSIPHDGRLPFDEADDPRAARTLSAAAEAPMAVAPTMEAPAVEPPTAAAERRSAPAPVAEPDGIAGVRAELGALKDRLGDTYPDFARAAALVVATQYASAARLQRELQVPYARARRLLTDLEAHRIVGPPTGPTPRQVLLPKDHLADLERVLAAA